MPIFGCNCLLVRSDGIQNRTETINVMRWECDSFGHSINESPQYDFGCSPRGIALFQFLDRCGFLTKVIIMFVKRPKHAIERSEKNSFDPSAGPYIALDEPTEIVHVNVPITQLFFEGRGAWNRQDVGRCNWQDVQRSRFGDGGISCEGSFWR